MSSDHDSAPDRQPTSVPPPAHVAGRPISPLGSDAAGSSAFNTAPYSIDHLGLDPTSRSVRVGHYLLKRVIGYGGMGTVYEAVQDQPRRSVAVKLMRSPLASRANRLRFEHESQLLARLRHPGIAQVFEAGTHRHGEGDSAVEVPFYAMEFIPGARSISEYVALKKPSEREIVELFVLVCDAVQHAHERGVLHRDLKPGNILVETATGQPKVIDFGIARSVDAAEMVEPTLQTSAHQLVGTLQYMSPEQLDCDPSELDARSDVYSLGVVLYELLCGRLPYDIGNANLPDATRIVREVLPVAPRALRPSLSRDLETVLLKALHKDPARRYQSAAELAADLRLALEGEPIVARRDSASYRLRTHWIRNTSRHRASSTILLALLSLLLAERISRALDQWPGATRWYERTVTSRLHTFDGPALRNVRVIALRPGTDFAALARSVGVEGVSNESAPTLRRLHAKVLEKLKDSGARVITFDIFFRTYLRGYDEPFATAIEALKQSGTDVVIGVPNWQPRDPGAEPAADASGFAAPYFSNQVSPTLRPHVQAGCVAMGFSGIAPWSLHLTVRHTAADALPSLALQTLASYRRPGAGPARVALDAGMQYLELRGTGSDPLPTDAQTVIQNRQVPVAPVQLTDVTWALDDPQYGLNHGDQIGSYVLEMPATEVLEASTLDYSSVLTASSDQLYAWFNGKAVVIGDLRPERDPPKAHPDGRKISGVYGHAVGIDSLLSVTPILRPRFFETFGIVVRGRYVFDLLAVAVGALAGIVLARGGARWWNAILAGLVLGALLIAASLLAYQLHHVLYNPLAACIALLATVLLAWTVHHNTHARVNARSHLGSRST